MLAFPRFPCGCCLAVARCRPGDATLSVHISGSLITSVLSLSLSHWSSLCHGLTDHYYHVSPCVEAPGLSPLSSPLSSLSLSLCHGLAHVSPLSCLGPGWLPTDGSELSGQSLAPAPVLRTALHTPPATPGQRYDPLRCGDPVTCHMWGHLMSSQFPH